LQDKAPFLFLSDKESISASPPYICCMQGQTLFLFTKQFPFGKHEKYVADELPYHAAAFDKVVLIPTEFFSAQTVPDYVLPANVDVFQINEQAKKGSQKKGGLGEFLSIWFHEFFHHPERNYFFKYLKRYASILRYQQLLADILTDYIRERNLPIAQSVFYTYWLHHSTLLLSILHKRGLINRFITRAHSVDLYNEKWPMISETMTPLPFMYFKLGRLDTVLAISNHGAKHLKQTFPRFAEKINQLYLGVDDCGKNPGHEQAVFTIVTCSQLSENKRMNRMPQILSLLDFPVRWIHFGGTEKEMDAFRKQMKAIPDRIQIDLRGYTRAEKIVAFYREQTVHLFVNLSKVEGVPVSIMEAESAGIPTMATAVFGTPELVNEETGFLLPVDFTNEEAAAFIRLLRNDPELQKRLRVGAAEKVEKDFRSTKNSRKLIDDFLMR
jgi:colanic acid/amylovoran biosynthesis glycosyltransferase